jgi:ABC-type transport system substrate-binding protein
MRPHFSIWRIAVGAALALNLLLLAVVAQAPKTDDKKPPMIDEEETTTPTKGVIRIEDKTLPKNTTRPASLDIDLGQAARSAKHPGIRELFSTLAIPHDVVHITNPLLKNRPDELVKPLRDYIGDKPYKISGKIVLHPFDKEWKEAKEMALSPSAVKEVVHYEQLAQKEVDKFLGEQWERLPAANDKYLSAIDKLIVAEQALTAAARFHEAARESEVRKGDAWNDVRKELRQRLLQVSLDRMQLLIENDRWDAALALVADTAKRFPTSDEQKTIAEPMAKLIHKLLETSADAAKYKDVFRRLQEIERSLPLAGSMEPIRKRLVELAQPHLAAAIEFKKANRLKEARDELRQATDIYPHLPGLKDLQLDFDDEYPTMRVGVSELPLNMSPALAFNEAERQVVEMLFEGLYELGPEPDGGRFRPVLARGRPGLIALGREIALQREAFWSNGKPIDASDVVSTLRLLRSDWQGHCEAWADDLMDDALVTDSFQVKLTLKQGCLDPLALMSFKILPAGPDKLSNARALDKPSDKDFAQKPIGSGPFMFDPNAHTEAGRPYARFLTNPYYRSRPGRTGLPRIREIQFFRSSDPVKEMADGKLDLVPDVPLDMVSAMRKTANVTVSSPLSSRRIYMLAVNHRHSNLDSAPLRRALAQAIPREKMLKDFFRHDLGDKVHQPLCGPYPTGSWACPPPRPDESDKADTLFNLTSAKASLRQAKKDKLSLSLKYPKDDSSVQKAMEFLKKHLETELAGLSIELKPVPLDNLRLDVLRDHEYDLAYYWYDYPDPTFWLWPILDKRSDRIGGPNFLGYQGGNGRLEQLCRDALNHRNFKNVQELTHTIHSVFVQQEMPFIPLWQLDRFIAHTNSVQILDGTRQLSLTSTTPEIDPLRVFGTVEYWRVNRTR